MDYKQIENLLIERAAPARAIDTLQKFLRAATTPPDTDKYFTGLGEGFLFYFDHGTIELELRGELSLVLGMVSEELNIDFYDMITL